MQQQVEKYVTSLFKTTPVAELEFHNLLHTQNVVKNAIEICSNVKLSETEKQAVIVAAWFHDTGHLFTRPQNHEEVSCAIMREFMMSLVNDTELIDNIAKCIMATKWPQRPQNLLEQIICDADVFHFGTQQFEENDRRAYAEYEMKYGYVDPVEFQKATVKLLQEHNFFTDYCKEHLSEQKEKNIQTLQRKILAGEEK